MQVFATCIYMTRSVIQSLVKSLSRPWCLPSGPRGSAKVLMVASWMLLLTFHFGALENGRAVESDGLTTLSLTSAFHDGPYRDTPTIDEECTEPPNWWDDERSFRLQIAVDMAGYERTNKPVDTVLNFSLLLGSLDEDEAFDAASIRVAEVSQSGILLDNNVPFQFDKDANYDETENASGVLVFMLDGVSPGNSTRYFHVYFNVAGSAYTPISHATQVSLVDGVQHEGQESYKITTQNAVYYYHKEGAGFASIRRCRRQ